MPPKWNVLQSNYILQNRWLSVRQDVCQLPNGRQIDDYYVVEDPNVGCVFALTPDRRLILVEQYKHAIADTCIELPAGGFENPHGDPRAESRREFREETGYDAPEFRYLAKMAQSPTRMTSYFHLFLALDAYPVGEQHLDPAEDITVHLVPLDDVFPMIERGEIHVMSTVACIYLATAHLRH